MLTWICTTCGASITALRGWELTEAAAHAKKAGHPPAPLKVGASGNNISTSSKSSPKRRLTKGEYTGLLILLSLLTINAIAIAFAITEDDPEEVYPGRCKGPGITRC